MRRGRRTARRVVCRECEARLGSWCRGVLCLCRGDALFFEVACLGLRRAVLSCVILTVAAGTARCRETMPMVRGTKKAVQHRLTDVCCTAVVLIHLFFQLIFIHYPSFLIHYPSFLCVIALLMLCQSTVSQACVSHCVYSVSRLVRDPMLCVFALVLFSHLVI